MWLQFFQCCSNVIIVLDAFLTIFYVRLILCFCITCQKLFPILWFVKLSNPIKIAPVRVFTQEPPNLLVGLIFFAIRTLTNFRINSMIFFLRGKLRHVLFPSSWGKAGFVEVTCGFRVSFQFFYISSFFPCCSKSKE